MKVRVSYTEVGYAGRQSAKVVIPDGARNIRAEVEIPVDSVPVDDFDVVRVRFERGHNEYCYRMQEGADLKIGEYAIVPANSCTPHPSIVRVVGYGRNAYRGTIHSVAKPLPA